MSRRRLFATSGTRPLQNLGGYVNQAAFASLYPGWILYEGSINLHTCSGLPENPAKSGKNPVWAKTLVTGVMPSGYPYVNFGCTSRWSWYKIRPYSGYDIACVNGYIYDFSVPIVIDRIAIKLLAVSSSDCGINGYSYTTDFSYLGRDLGIGLLYGQPVWPGVSWSTMSADYATYGRWWDTDSPWEEGGRRGWYYWWGVPHTTVFFADQCIIKLDTPKVLLPGDVIKIALDEYKLSQPVYNRLQHISILGSLLN